MTPASRTPRTVRVVFVCWRNICRSPMAERVAERAAADAGLTDVEFTSAATSREELGAPIDERVEAVLRTDLPRRTDGTLTDPDAVRADLAVVRERGYAVDDEENERNIRCVATVVPEVAGHPLRAVSISTVTFLTDRDQLMGYVPALLQCARSLATS